MPFTRSRFLKGGVAAIATTLAIGGAGAVYAQTASPTPRTGPPFGQGARAGMAAGQHVAAGVPQSVLQRLGMTAEQLAAERQAGKSLAQIAQAKGVSKQALVDLILADRKAVVDERVKAGTLTQAQADAMLAQMKERVTTAVDRTEVGPPPWAGPGNGGFGLGMHRGTSAGARGPMAAQRGPAAAPGAPNAPATARRGTGAGPWWSQG
jgi:hypothetical protein